MDEATKNTGKSRLRKVMSLRVRKLADIARIAATSITMGQPSYFIRLRNNGSTILGMLAVFRDYYSLYGIPLFYYIECAEDDQPCSTSPYVAFKVDELGESVEYASSNRPGMVMIPVVDLEDIPPFLEV